MRSRQARLESLVNKNDYKDALVRDIMSIDAKSRSAEVFKYVSQDAPHIAEDKLDRYAQLDQEAGSAYIRSNLKSDVIGNLLRGSDPRDSAEVYGLYQPTSVNRLPDTLGYMGSLWLDVMTTQAIRDEGLRRNLADNIAHIYGNTGETDQSTGKCMNTNDESLISPRDFKRSQVVSSIAARQAQRSLYDRSKNAEIDRQIDLIGKFSRDSLGLSVNFDAVQKIAARQVDIDPRKISRMVIGSIALGAVAAGAPAGLALADNGLGSSRSVESQGPVLIRSSGDAVKQEAPAPVAKEAPRVVRATGEAVAKQAPAIAVQPKKVTIVNEKTNTKQAKVVQPVASTGPAIKAASPAGKAEVAKSPSVLGKPATKAPESQSVTKNETAAQPRSEAPEAKQTPSTSETERSSTTPDVEKPPVTKSEAPENEPVQLPTTEPVMPEAPVQLPTTEPVTPEVEKVPVAPEAPEAERRASPEAEEAAKKQAAEQAKERAEKEVKEDEKEQAKKSAPETKSHNEKDDKEYYKQLLETIAGVEAGGNYNAYFGNGSNTKIKFTSMTLREVLDWQRSYVAGGSPSSAVGKYQFLDGTLKGLIDKHDISMDEKFDEDMQDELAFHLLERRGLNKYLKGDISAKQFAHSLSKEWASLPRVTGGNPQASYYAHDGLNASLVSVDKIMSAIKSTKQEYQHEIAEKKEAAAKEKAAQEAKEKAEREAAAKKKAAEEAKEKAAEEANSNLPGRLGEIVSTNTWGQKVPATIGGHVYIGQTDVEVANHEYNVPGGYKATIGGGACGPATSLTAVKYFLPNNETSLIEATNHFQNKGYRVSGGSTNIGVTRSIEELSGGKLETKTYNLANMSVEEATKVIQRGLEAGHIFAISGRDNRAETPATSGGHFYVISDIDPNDREAAYVLDPNNVTKSTIAWNIAKSLVTPSKNNTNYLVEVWQK